MIMVNKIKMVATILKLLLSSKLLLNLRILGNCNFDCQEKNLLLHKSIELQALLYRIFSGSSIFPEIFVGQLT